jgi:hypothetical protein
LFNGLCYFWAANRALRCIFSLKRMPLRSLPGTGSLPIYYIMKLYEFLALSDEFQYQAVWNQGVHIDNILFEKVNYQLYSINDFYVEVHYDAISNTIVGKLAFKGGEPLDKYLGGLPEV